MTNITKNEKDSNRLAYYAVTKRFMVSVPRVIMHVEVADEQEKYKNSEISIIRLVTNKLSLKQKKSNRIIFSPKIDHHVSREFLTHDKRNNHVSSVWRWLLPHGAQWTSSFSKASKLFGMTISLGKTEVLVQPAPHSQSAAPAITIDGASLAIVKCFKYLRSTL